jgi:hypothetical protein
VHTHDAQRAMSGFHFRHHRAARFKRRDGDQTVMSNVERLADQDGVAVPADAVRPRVKRHSMKSGLFDKRQRQGALSQAKAAVGFLQQHDIRGDFGKDVNDPLRPPQPVCADGFADIVAGEFHHIPLIAADARLAKSIRNVIILVDYHILM